MKGRSPLLALPLALLLVAAGCSTGDDSGGGGTKKSAKEEKGSPEAASPLDAEDADPADCTGDSVFIEAVEIPGVKTDPVIIPEVKNKAGEVVQEEQEIPGVNIPDQRVPAQCATVDEAPAGCLGAASIPPTEIPPVTIPEVTIPAFEYGDVEVEEVTADAVTSEGVQEDGVTAEEVCQISEEEAGEGGYISSVYRSSIYRPSLYRASAYRGSAYRGSARLDDGTKIPSVRVDGVRVDGVRVDGVRVEGERLKGRRVEDVDVLEGEDSITFGLDADVLFATDSDEIRPDGAKTLAEVADQIKELPDDAPIKADGHTDSDGDEDHNKDLSERRAQAVVDWLVEKESLDADRFTVTGYGETKPVASNDDDKGKQKNRRVMISADI
ncbi:OmpA family protein [Nocardiopsis gilva YIM 90087]|uniref:OmpA family protein n=1 Tax=Nocardiopsis gilva YIM 90087 TaxID=1235441 RepID=A0A223S011_9ACTN|nr:OmpA family protein [Nocardiopsis gilva]ASU81473.1 OmpA family protein [Nocardiopsis gilva YIM 90087]